MSKDQIYQTIKASGGRLTKTRKAIVDILFNSCCLMTEQDMKVELAKQSQRPNRSTLFREFAFLVKHAIVIKNTISGVDYYEIPQDHHHHLVCLTCNSIDKIHIGNHLEKQEQKIAKQTKFSITNHSLDFYGYCKDCKP